jgi:hypothetical protein
MIVFGVSPLAIVIDPPVDHIILLIEAEDTVSNDVFDDKSVNDTLFVLAPSHLITDAPLFTLVTSYAILSYSH